MTNPFTTSFALALLVSMMLPELAAARPVRNTTRASVNRAVDAARTARAPRELDPDGAAGRSLPPSCSTVVVNDVTFQNCSGTWYQPRYSGTDVTYVVVNPPQG